MRFHLAAYFHRAMSLFLYLLILFRFVFFQVAIKSEKRDPPAKQSTLDKKLFHYETLAQGDISIHVRRQRDANTGHVLVRTYVTFFTLGRNFNVILKAGSPVLATGFKAYTVDGHGSKTPLAINPDDFFTGYLQENVSIAVDAHYEDGLLCMTIYFPNETYITEPSWRHLPGSSKYYLISYRLSEVNWSLVGPFAAPRTLVKPQNSNSSVSENEQHPRCSHSKRRRAASAIKKTCPLRLVADYLFYNRHSCNSAVGAVQSMVSSVQEANRIYQSTTWKFVNSSGWGFAVKEVLVHTEYSSGPSNGPFSYNYKKAEERDIEDMLTDFSRNRDLLHFCLAHLFTTYSFQKDPGSAGYGFSGDPWATGGVCSEEKMDETRSLIYPRTSFTTSVDQHSHFLTRMQHQLVTAHELGHNWGSLHDPAGPCTPTEEEGGHYLMYMYSVEGSQPNNFRFSNCSIDLISRTLAAVSHFCFIEGSPADSLCGNGLVDDKDEECDAGVTAFESQDKCCSSVCTLRDYAECSDFNDPCCRNCKLATEGTVCQSNFDFQCLQESKCDGLSYACPPALPSVDGTVCLDGGTCLGGRCITYCEALGKNRNQTHTTCLCEHNVTAACMRCCMEVFADNTKGPCFPTDQLLGYGQRCYIGECDENGVCVAAEGHFLRKLAAFFQHSDFNALWEIMKTNIVMTIIVLSALIWIPACLFASFSNKTDEEARKRRPARLQQVISEPAATPEQETKDINDTEQQKSVETKGRHVQIRLGSSVDDIPQKVEGD